MNLIYSSELSVAEKVENILMKAQPWLHLKRGHEVVGMRGEDAADWGIWMEADDWLWWNTFEDQPKRKRPKVSVRLESSSLASFRVFEKRFFKTTQHFFVIPGVFSISFPQHLLFSLLSAWWPQIHKKLIHLFPCASLCASLWMWLFSAHRRLHVISACTPTVLTGSVGTISSRQTLDSSPLTWLSLWFLWGPGNATGYLEERKRKMWFHRLIHI